jgi:hypothetical protein
LIDGAENHAATRRSSRTVYLHKGEASV